MNSGTFSPSTLIVLTPTKISVCFGAIALSIICRSRLAHSINRFFMLLLLLIDGTNIQQKNNPTKFLWGYFHFFLAVICPTTTTILAMDSFLKKETISSLFCVFPFVVVTFFWAFVGWCCICFDGCTQGEQSDKEEKNFFHFVMNY